MRFADEAPIPLENYFPPGLTDGSRATTRRVSAIDDAIDSNRCALAPPPTAMESSRPVLAGIERSLTIS